MFWGYTVTALICALSLYIRSEKLGVAEQQEDNGCADLTNTTWQQYRQRTKLQVRYLLLMRNNLECAQAFSEESLSKTLLPPHFNTSLKSKVIIHGYRAMGSKPSWVMELAQVLLRAEDVNVLIVDWVYGASFAYNLVVENYKEVSVQISVLINQLQKQGSKLESFHLIGVSLGAHVAGFVGTLFEGKIGRITALDPAGPMFKRADTFDRLDPSDAKFVDAIHTDSDYFGISIPVGHIDFFLNGGNDQTGCARSRFASMYGYVICDHMRALHVYMSALNGSCALTALPCTSYEDFLMGKCVDCNVFKGTCPSIGLSENSGITLSPVPKEQRVFLITTSSAPFCAHHILLELDVTPLDKSAEMELTLIKGNQKVAKRLRLENLRIKGQIVNSRTQLKLRNGSRRRILDASRHYCLKQHLLLPDVTPVKIPPADPDWVVYPVNGEVSSMAFSPDGCAVLSGTTFICQTDSTVFRTVLAHQTPLCEIESITLRNTGTRFYRQADIHVRSVCLTQLPRREAPLCVNKFDVHRGAPWSHDFVQVCN